MISAALLVRAWAIPAAAPYCPALIEVPARTPMPGGPAPGMPYMVRSAVLIAHGAAAHTQINKHYQKG